MELCVCVKLILGEFSKGGGEGGHPQFKSYEALFVLALFLSQTEFEGVETHSTTLNKCFFSPSHAKVTSWLSNTGWGEGGKGHFRKITMFRMASLTKWLFTDLIYHAPYPCVSENS